jgi:hypothetical protein
VGNPEAAQAAQLALLTVVLVINLLAVNEGSENGDPLLAFSDLAAETLPGGYPATLVASGRWAKISSWLLTL